MIGQILLGLDVWTAGRVVVSAGFYGAALLTVGGLLFRLAFPSLPSFEERTLRRVSLVAAWAGIGLVLLLWPLQAAYLGGGSLAAARDPILLRIVAESPQGHRLFLAVAGFLLLQLSLWEGRWLAVRQGVGLVGAALALLAFAQVGHTRGDFRLGGLLMLHLLVAAFWLAALSPLYRLAGEQHRGTPPVRLLRRFGRLGLVLIPLLLLAGGGLAIWLVEGRPASLLGSAYGQVLMLKLGLVVLLLALGAFNKWRLVPAIERGVPGAKHRLRRSIATEGVLMGLLLLTVALLLTTGAPRG
ncbi:CopD family protein [Halomonas sp. MCCC 1A11057]|uniref:CopD family protein n=1 Tax=Halomonas sp. MCCC 1A11057 TaxID=2733482 RepID=UPI001F277CE0